MFNTLRVSIFQGEIAGGTYCNWREEKLLGFNYYSLSFDSILAPSESATQQQTNSNETIAPLFFFDDTMLVADVPHDVYFL